MPVSYCHIMSCTTSTLYPTENRVISFHKSKKISEVIQQNPEPIQNTPLCHTVPLERHLLLKPVSVVVQQEKQNHLEIYIKGLMEKNWHIRLLGVLINRAGHQRGQLELLGMNWSCFP